MPDHQATGAPGQGSSSRGTGEEMGHWDGQLRGLRMRTVRSSVWETLVEDPISFHIYPGSDLDITKDKQQGQKMGEI